MRKKRTDIPYNKILWTDAQLQFMKDNFHSMTNQEIANALGLKITAVRMKLYSMGLYKMTLEYWTPEQIEFLKKNFRTIGDTELAGMFNKRWKKAKGWTKKHIEKKRRYLKLKRTKAECAAIHQRNVDNGMFVLCAVKRWKATGQAKEGEIRMWREGKNGRWVPRVKVNGRFINWNRWKWEQEYGSVPEGMYVRFKGDPENLSIDNLELISAKEHKHQVSQSSSTLSDGYIAGILSHKDPELRTILRKQPGLIELKRNQLLLARAIKSNQNDKS